MAQSLARENRILSALLEVSKVLNSSFDLEKNLSRTMRVLGDFLEMERGSVFLFDNNSKELGIVAAQGLTKEQIERGKYKIGEGIVGRVLEKGYAHGYSQCRSRTFVHEQDRIKDPKERHFVSLRAHYL